MIFSVLLGISMFVAGFFIRDTLAILASLRSPKSSAANQPVTELTTDKMLGLEFIPEDNAVVMGPESGLKWDNTYNPVRHYTKRYVVNTTDTNHVEEVKNILEGSGFLRVDRVDERTLQRATGVEGPWKPVTTTTTLIPLTTKDQREVAALLGTLCERLQMVRIMTEVTAITQDNADVPKSATTAAVR